MGPPLSQQPAWSLLVRAVCHCQVAPGNDKLQTRSRAGPGGPDANRKSRVCAVACLEGGWTSNKHFLFTASIFMARSQGTGLLLVIWGPAPPR